MCDLPTGDLVLLEAGLSTADFTLADVSSTIIPVAYDMVIKDISVLVRNEVLKPRVNDSTNTKFYLDHKYICDGEFSSFDITTGVDDVLVFDSEDYTDVSGTTITIASIDALQGFVTLSDAHTDSLYASYRWSPVAAVGGSTDQLLRQAILFKTATILWDSIVGVMDQVNVQSYQVTQRNHFRERYNEIIEKIKSMGEAESGETAFRVKERKTHQMTIKKISG